MDSDPRKILDDFSALPDEDKREVLAELLRMTRELDQPTAEQDEQLAEAEELLRKQE
jgi:hypothetical protein